MFNIDKQLEKIGFQKLHGDNKETKYRAFFKKKCGNKNNYTKILEICMRDDGNHLISIYQGIGEDYYPVGLTYKETKLAMKKYRQMKRRYGWK